MSRPPRCAAAEEVVAIAGGLERACGARLAEAEDRVVARVAVQRVAGRAALESVVARLTGGAVLAAERDERVVTGLEEEALVGVRAEQDIRGGRSVDRGAAAPGGMRGRGQPARARDADDDEEHSPHARPPIRS